MKANKPKYNLTVDVKSNKHKTKAVLITHIPHSDKAGERPKTKIRFLKNIFKGDKLNIASTKSMTSDISDHLSC